MDRFGYAWRTANGILTETIQKINTPGLRSEDKTKNAVEKDI